MISGTTKIAGVIATPIKHSLSPLIHNTAFDLLGIDAVYLAFDVASDNFADAVKAITVLDFIGVNLSMPYKEEVIPYLDQLGSEVLLSGAVNTIINQNGSLIGRNTDGFGYLASLRAAGYQVADEQVTILGGGGAAMAIISQLALSGVKKIAVFNRKSANFLPLQKKLNYISEQTQVLIELFDLLDETSLKQELSKSLVLTNTTRVGMGELRWASPLHNSSVINKDLLVTDAIYNPRQTKFLQQAHSRQAKTMNGLGMLLYQAAKSFFFWTGKEMPVEQVKSELEKNLKNFD